MLKRLFSRFALEGKKSLERIAKLEGDRIELCRVIDRLQEEKKFSSECIRRLRAEKAEAFGDNQKLLARRKELEKLVLSHQEVSRERAISEDKLKARISDLEKEKKQLEFARQAEEEKTASALQELDNARQQLFKSCNKRVAILLAGLSRNLEPSLRSLMKMVSSMCLILRCRMRQLAFRVAYFNLLLDALELLARPCVLLFTRVVATTWQICRLSFPICY